jgi:hypothetical protein
MRAMTAVLFAWTFGCVCACSSGSSNQAGSPGSDGGGDDATASSDGGTGNDGSPNDAPPPMPDAGPAVLHMESSVTDRGGVTWTFSQPAAVGQFVTGDYFVVGEVTVTGISPAPDTAAPYKNGSVKNLPTANGHSAWDQRLNDGTDQSWFFDPSFRLVPPFKLVPGDALVSAVSLATPHTLPEPFGDSASAVNQSPIRSMSVLTVVGVDPAADAFRPSYCDRAQTLYHAGVLQRGLLPSLAPPNPSSTPKISDYEPHFSRPWIDVTFFLWDVPGEYMPSYSRDFGFVEAYATLLLTLNFPADQKVNLTNGLVQRGIDLYGCAKAGVTWPAWGGYGHGRKLPILLAGLLLDEASMKNVSATYPVFGEDQQTVYVNHIPGGYTQAWQGAKVIYAGHEGVKPDGTTRDPSSFNGASGPYEQLQPSAWPVWSGEQLGEAYRRCCTSTVWVGEALAARLLGLHDVWNYPAFFDYADRWMTEDDTQSVAAIKAQSGFDYSASWERQKQTAAYLQGRVPEYTFVDDMWGKYR